MQKSNIYTARMRDKDSRCGVEWLVGKRRQCNCNSPRERDGNRRQSQRQKANKQTDKTKMEEATHTNRGYVRRPGCKLFPLFPKFVSALKCQCTQARKTHSYASLNGVTQEKKST